MTSDPRRQCLPSEDWPTVDRELWACSLRGGDDLDDPACGASLSTGTLSKIIAGYGRWLGFLAYQRELDSEISPAARVTLVRVREYVRLMRAMGNRDHTVVGRMLDLRTALRIMMPEVDLGWLTAPGGISLRSRLPMAKRPIEVPHSRVLFQWGLEMMETAMRTSAPVRRSILYRDGLLIAILAARAPRLRSITALRVGRHIIRQDGRFRMLLDPEDVKTKRPIEADLPASLTPYLERYLSVERTKLLAGQQHDWLWVNWDGNRLDRRGIDKRIRWWSAKRFGTAFGPHRFRHAIGTTAPIEDPLNPGVAAAIMGISPGILEEHYNRADHVAAARRFHATLQDERQRTEPLARRSFDETTPRIRSVTGTP